MRALSADTGGGSSTLLSSAAGHLDFVQVAQRSVHGLEIHLDDLLALLAVGLLDRILDVRRWLRRCGSTPEIAKKQTCMMVLMRPPMPLFLATLKASIT